jgi:hypothetical protein
MPIAERPAAVNTIFERGWNEGDFSDLEEWLAPELNFHVQGAARLSRSRVPDTRGGQ